MLYTFLRRATNVALGWPPPSVRVARALRIRGNLRGSITTSSTLIVGKRATVQADINAGGLRVTGTVLGNVVCDGPVEIRAGGHLRGDVLTPRLIIKEGGRFDGVSRPVTGSAADGQLSEPELHPAVG